jgi:inositol 1,4,5-triphosphate receptor type 1
MKVLGLMCDGQFREMQDFIRAQSEQMNGVDLVGEVTTFLQTIHQNQTLDSTTIRVLHCMLQTLIEMGVGNHANQRAIFNRQILPVINRILQVDISDIKAPPQGKWVSISPSLDSNDPGVDDGDFFPWYYRYDAQTIPPEAFKELKKQAVELKGSAIELLEGMLEETSHETRELVMRVSGGLDIDALHGTMVDFYKLKEDWELKKDEYDDNAERGMYRTYHILIQLQYYKVPYQLGIIMEIPAILVYPTHIVKLNTASPNCAILLGWVTK